MNYQELSRVANMANILLDGYVLENGIIKNPGKFEGETVATLYYYDAYLNGAGYYHGYGCIMSVTEEEAAIFELKESDNFVYLAESNDGFVSLEFYKTEEEAEERESEEYDDGLSEEE